MNPVEITEDIRRLELMLHGGMPMRPDADFGKQEMGHFDGVKSRSPEVKMEPTTLSVEPDLVIEQYVVSVEGAMVVKGARSGGK